LNLGSLRATMAMLRLRRAVICSRGWDQPAGAGRDLLGGFDRGPLMLSLRRSGPDRREQTGGGRGREEQRRADVDRLTVTISASALGLHRRPRPSFPG
jgi:hypothetical protein